MYHILLSELRRIRGFYEKNYDKRKIRLRNKTNKSQ